MRLSAGKLALIISKIRENGLAEEASSLESHLDSIGSESFLLDHLQSMTEATTKSALAEQATATVLESWKPIIQKSQETLAKMMELEERRLKMEEREFEQSKTEVGLKYQHVIAPVVAGIIGLLSTIVAYLVGSGATP